MANDELQTRIAEQKKLVEDKKKLLQNLKNLEQVEKEVRVEIDKILPEKTKFEEWAKYFGNDGKSDQVLNWFGDELKKLKAKLDRVQGMRTKINAVQDKIDSQLVRLNQEIENLKKLPKPVVRHVQDEINVKNDVSTFDPGTQKIPSVTEEKPVAPFAKNGSQKPNSGLKPGTAPILNLPVKTEQNIAEKVIEPVKPEVKTLKPVAVSPKASGTPAVKPAEPLQPETKAPQPDSASVSNSFEKSGKESSLKPVIDDRSLGTSKVSPSPPKLVVTPVSKEPGKPAVDTRAFTPATPGSSEQKTLAASLKQSGALTEKPAEPARPEKKTSQPEVASVSNSFEKSKQELPKKPAVEAQSPGASKALPEASKPAGIAQNQADTVGTKTSDNRKSLAPLAETPSAKKAEFPPKQNGLTSETPAGKPTDFSPVKKNLLQDIARKAKLTAEKIEAEKSELPVSEKTLPVEPAVPEPVAVQKDTIVQDEKEAPGKPAEKITAKLSANAELEAKQVSEPVKKSDTTSDLTQNEAEVRPSEKKASSEIKAESRPEASFTHSVKSQKYQYINGQPIRDKNESESGANTSVPETVSRPETPGTPSVPEEEKRPGLFSNMKEKFFGKGQPPVKTKAPGEEAAPPKTKPAGRVTREGSESSLAEDEDAFKFSDLAVPKATESIEAHRIFDDSVPVTQSEFAPETQENPEAESVKKNEIVVQPAESEKTEPRQSLEISKIPRAGSVTNAPSQKIEQAEKPKPEVVIQATSLLDAVPDGTREVKKEIQVEVQSFLTDPPKPVMQDAEKQICANEPLQVSQKPSGDSSPTSISRKTPELSVKKGLMKQGVNGKKAGEENPPQEIIVETQSLLHDIPENTATNKEPDALREIRPKEKSKIETPKPGTQSPEVPGKKWGKTEIDKPEPATSEINSDSRKTVDPARVLAPFRSKEDVLYLGIDLGTYETTIAASNGVVATAVSAVGWPKDLISRNLLKKEILFGEEALKHKLALKFFRPLAEGVIKDTEEDLQAATELIKHVLTMIRPEKFKKVYAVIGAPAQANLHNEQAIFDAAREVIDAVTIVSEPFAVAYGEANIYNTLVIDIGAGTTDLCRLRGTMPNEDDQITLLKAGDYIDVHLVEALEQRVKGVQVTKDMARRWKEAYSFVLNTPKPVLVDVTVEGKPLKVDISSCIQKSCEMIVDDIADSTRKLISTFDPEFQPELKQNIILAGGGSLIHNLDVYLTQKLNMLGKVNIKKVLNPIEAGARGALALAMDVTDDFWRGLS